MYKDKPKYPIASIIPVICKNKFLFYNRSSNKNMGIKSIIVLKKEITKL